MPEKIKTIIPLKYFKGTEWQPFLGEKLPPTAEAFAKKNDVFRSRCGRWVDAYYKGDINTTDQWVIVTDDGGYYKVGASYMMWYPCSKPNPDFGCCSQALWSWASLRKSLKSLITLGKTTFDPDYQT